jgi:hypothetical protein
VRQPKYWLPFFDSKRKKTELPLKEYLQKMGMSLDGEQPEVCVWSKEPGEKTGWRIQKKKRLTDKQILQEAVK